MNVDVVFLSCEGKGKFGKRKESNTDKILVMIYSHKNNTVLCLCFLTKLHQSRDS